MSKPRCKHCGTSISPPNEVSAFCCSGCEHVYQLIRSEGLDTFYDLRAGAVVPVGDSAETLQDFGWASQLQSEVEGAGGECRMQVRLDGLSCLGCIWLVEHLFKRIEGAGSIRVSVEERSMTMGWQREQMDVADFLALLQRFGYRASAYRAGLTSTWSPLTWRLLLCAVFAANSVLLSFAERLLGGDDSYSGLFSLLGVLFALLSLLVGGSHFIVPALRSVRVGIVHYDLLTALGLLLLPAALLEESFMAGQLGLALWKLPLVVFLVVLGRWLHVRMRPHAEDDLNLQKHGVAAVRIHFWIRSYVYAVLVIGLWTCAWLAFQRGGCVVDVAAAAFLVGALYPIARVANLKPHPLLLGAGLALCACGVLFALTGRFGSIGAAGWMLASGLVWHGLSALVCRQPRV